MLANNQTTPIFKPRYGSRDNEDLKTENINFEATANINSRNNSPAQLSPSASTSSKGKIIFKEPQNLANLIKKRNETKNKLRKVE